MQNVAEPEFLEVSSFRTVLLEYANCSLWFFSRLCPFASHVAHSFTDKPSTNCLGYKAISKRKRNIIDGENNYCEMTAVHLVKVKLDGDLRIMEIPSPPLFDALVRATAEAYALQGTEGFIYTYQDADADQVNSTACSCRESYFI